VQGQVADDDLVGGGTAQLACQVVIVEPDSRSCLPRVLVDRRGLAEASREACRADFPAEHTGSRGLQRRRAILTVVVAPAPPRVVAHHRPCLRVARSTCVDDVASVAVLSLSARVKDPLPDRCSALVSWSPHRSVCLDGCLLALGAVVVPRAALMAYVGCRAFGLLYDSLLDERLRLAVQVSCLGRRRFGHGPEQRRNCN
jgi:hypothetical protein